MIDCIKNSDCSSRGEPNTDSKANVQTETATKITINNSLNSDTDFVSFIPIALIVLTMLVVAFVMISFFEKRERTKKAQSPRQTRSSTSPIHGASNVVTPQYIHMTNRPSQPPPYHDLPSSAPPFTTPLRNVK